MAMLAVAFTVFGAPVKLAGLNETQIKFPESNRATLRIDANASENSVKKSQTKADDSAEWVEIGEGYYKDVFFSELFNKKPQTFKVKWEQKKDDPTIYRIPNLYENMDFSEYGGYLTFNASNCEPMVIQTYYTDYAFFSEFDTGVYCTYKNATTDYTGRVSMLMNGEYLLNYNSPEAIIVYCPECMMQLNQGTFRMEPYFVDDQGYRWYNQLGVCNVTYTSKDTVFHGNSGGDFALTMPGYDEYDDNADWEDLGNCLFRDVFTEGLYPDTPRYGEWEVPMQRSKSDATYYRLVNPFKYWDNPFINISYDNDKNYYMTLIIREYEGFSLVGIPEFRTGLELDGYGAFSVGNQAADQVKVTTDFLGLYAAYPGCLGMMQNDEITYESHCVIDMTFYQNFYGFVGPFDWNGQFISVNGSGNFYIRMPNAAGIDTVITDSNLNAPIEYYNLQGVKVLNPEKGKPVIRRQGKSSKVVIF